MANPKKKYWRDKFITNKNENEVPRPNQLFPNQKPKLI
jgi:hypothetical protein